MRPTSGCSDKRKRNGKRAKPSLFCKPLPASWFQTPPLYASQTVHLRVANRRVTKNKPMVCGKQAAGSCQSGAQYSHKKHWGQRRGKCGKEAGKTLKKEEKHRSAKNNRQNACRNRAECLPLQPLTKIWALSSVGLERLPYKQRVGGSNPSAPTRMDRKALHTMTVCKAFCLPRG